MGQPVFIVIDIQNDYFPGGAMALYEPDRAAQKARQALEHARLKKMPCIVVQHIAENPGATFFKPGTRGVEIHRDFSPLADEIHLVKHHPSAFHETRLQGELQRLGAEEIIVVGMMTHMCIDSTVRRAADLGYRVTVLGDATATCALQFGGETTPAPMVQTAYLAALHGSFAKVITTAQWVTEA